VSATEAIESFRAEVRGWLSETLPAEWCTRAFPRTNPPGHEDPEGVAISRHWHGKLYEAGWVAPGWPIDHGGKGLDLTQLLVLGEELARAKAPVPIGFQGIDLLGPTLIAHASESQKEAYLPGILSGEEVWCQGYSEPDAGSDLASLRTTARSGGDSYVVNGTKVWTSFGNRATWCFLLARTGAPDSGNRGISFFVVRMDAPGLEWRPITELTGAREFGELVLDDVVVPADQLIGGEGDGWRIAMSSLGHERLLAANSAHVRVRYEALSALARRLGGARDRDKVVKARIGLQGLEGLQARAVALALAKDAQFSIWSSMVKLAATTLRREIAESAVSILGPAAIACAYGGAIDPDDEPAVWAQELLDSQAATIYAGTSNIQRNIIAERGLGLPKGT
jgi:alkylation response protein AidB-like acyl-CoA dehydrogenase